ncbi:3-oxoacyl-[acyl-carrier-protein] synthase III C-terminal domain-containing protein [Maridesulfovibrio hydrothermalis]|uniref:3-oxoacyl-[acyl-carrier-protein] synthase III C-terminal domain-containing protein n=1 Tax=Maridesulfovibrio hydrothermalis TaxID=191026 RepID=UPI0002D70B77|nr:3-oxoacyl-[acyl-carrier-protein] synthase III C-terminal domain-containing protein [Maridesulfovibrio hydrothermalis]
MPVILKTTAPIYSSSSIPIALKRTADTGKLKRGDKVLIFGFGIGLSWSGAIFNY